ncbi:Carbonic anhydrase [Sulfidibacter corallicola]|uniref:Carbonic anhydrase n=1 Tax=Sulfidibacter corallicola TaxID=2818388 RepID=A0A8A4TJ70_SULCO|nr:carbonic anhydrase [Sulfidibacter corallicola]QTD48848.1 carbonic anhydrase [Sulfidibacter corallicola]
MKSAREALVQLKEGNQRFVSGVRSVDPLQNQSRRDQLVAGQAPYAVIVGCSDSRVPVETVFDQDLGDLFVIRVAGNVISPPLIGSVEFAAAKFGTRLVVVMGHTQCGAVGATIQELQGKSETKSPNLLSIVDSVRPAVESLLETDLKNDQEALVRQSVRANVRLAADHLRQGSEILEDLIENDGLMVIGAEYSLETGEVDFFDGCDDQ